MKKAPEFHLETTLGAKTLADFSGKLLILYFYPKDMTSGCTRQAQDFRDMKGAFESADAVILGVSKDSLTRHKKFIEKEGLNFLLASDENGHVCADYGVWKQKSMYGKTYMGIERSTFLIDENGNLVSEWRKVKVPGHVAAVLEAVRAFRREFDT